MNDERKCCCVRYIENDETLKIRLTTDAYNVYGNINKGEKIVIRYFGKLIEKIDSENFKIFLTYGYGNLWNDKNVIEMDPCSYSDIKSYCVEIELINIENLFFCFLDENNNWDLNQNSSYMITIDSPITTLIKQEYAVALAEDDCKYSSNSFMQKFTRKLLEFFMQIGNIFEKRIKL